MDDLSKFKEFNISFVPGNMSPIEYVVENEVYLYGLEHKNAIPVPIDKINVEVSQKMPLEVLAGSQKFSYDGSLVYSKKGNHLFIGNNIKYDFNPPQISFKISGNLKERIKDLQLRTAFFENKEIIINYSNNPLTAKADSKKLDIKQLEITKDKLNYYNEIDVLMHFFNVDDPLEMNNITKEEYANLNYIIDIVLYNKKIEHEPGITGFRSLKIGNLKILMFVTVDKNGYLCIDNPYDIEKYGCKLTYNNESVRSSPYIILESESLKNINNLDFDAIEKSIKSYPLNGLYFDHITFFILELIKLYDKNNKFIDSLRIALNLCNWLDEYEKINPFINKINKLQIIVRQRPLQQDEIDELIKIKESSKLNFKILCGVNILLNNNLEFNYYFDKLSKEEKEEFCTYPIYNLLSK